MFNTQYGGKDKIKIKKDNLKKDKIKKASLKKDKIKEESVKKIGLTDREEIPRNIYDKMEYKIEPIKLLYQYKNNNKKIEYQIFIFVGIIGNRYKSILEKIKDLDIYDTLKEISIEDEKKLSKGFGEFWIAKLFNKYHISGFINKIENNDEIKKVILNKFEEGWLVKFVNKFKSDVIFKKVNYSYAELIKFEFKVKMGKKLEKIELEKEDIEDLNFTKYTKKSNNILYQVSADLLNEQQIQKGGEDENQDKVLQLVNKHIRTLASKVFQIYLQSF